MIEVDVDRRMSKPSARQARQSTRAWLPIVAVAMVACRDVDQIEFAAQSDGSESDLTESIAVDRCEVGVVSQSSGIVVEVIRNMPWETGVCVDLQVTNASEDAQVWWFRVRLGGDYSSSWNSQSMHLEDNDWHFEGDPGSNNVALLPGAMTALGICMECEPNSSG